MSEIECRECDFKTYCPLCKYSDVKETDNPCNFCLEYPANEFTVKPVMFEEKDNA